MVTKIIEVIETHENRGNGKTTTYRQVYQLWSKEGILIYEDDPCKDEDLIDKKEVNE